MRTPLGNEINDNSYTYINKSRFSLSSFSFLHTAHSYSVYSHNKNTNKIHLRETSLKITYHKVYLTRENKTLRSFHYGSRKKRLLYLSSILTSKYGFIYLLKKNIVYSVTRLVSFHFSSLRRSVLFFKTVGVIS